MYTTSQVYNRPKSNSYNYSGCGQTRTIKKSNFFYPDLTEILHATRSESDRLTVRLANLVEFLFVGIPVLFIGILSYNSPIMRVTIPSQYAENKKIKKVPKKGPLHGKYNTSHIFQPIGMIFEYVVDLPISHLYTKLQHPSSFTFLLIMSPVRYTFYLFMVVLGLV